MSAPATTTVRVYVKLLSGDLLPLDVPRDTRYSDLYHEVAGALPDEICPMEIWQLTLTRLSPEGEYLELPSTLSLAELQEGEELCALIENRYLNGYLGQQSYAVEDCDPHNVAHVEERLYEVENLQLMCEEVGMIEQEFFLYHTITNTYYRMTATQGQWKDDNDFLFSFTEKKEEHAFTSFAHFVDDYLTRLDGYSTRTKQQLRRSWLEEFDQRCS